MNENLITMQNVGVAFHTQLRMNSPRFWALEDVSLTLARGDRLGIIGRNGAGKSTLLRTIAGILLPDRGQMQRSQVICQLLSLNLGFLAHLSGRDNAILSGMMSGLHYRDIVQRLPAILDFSELGDFFEEPLSTYSTGMMSRLGFSVAMQVQPDVLLLDEVLSVGDAEFQEKSGQALRERIHGGNSIVFVSHDDTAIRQICTHAVWIEHGKSVMHGNVDEVLEAYHRDAHPAAT